MHPFNRFARNKISSDPFIRACLAHYAYNLMGKIDMTGEYLWILLRLLPEEQQAQMGEWMKSKKIKADSHTPYLNCATDMYESADEMWGDIKRSQYSVTRKAFEKYLFALFAGWFKKAKNHETRNELTELKQLQAIFGLDDGEKEIVRLLYCIQILHHCMELFKTNRVTEFIRMASTATGIPFRKIKGMLACKSALIQKGIVIYRNNEGDQRYRLLDAVVDYLSGVTDVPLKERFIKENKAERYELPSFNVAESAIAIIQPLLLSGKPCNLLLYGRPGTGKTEFAKAVTASVGGKPFFFQRGDSSNSGHFDCNTDLVNIRATINLVPSKGVLIVDEADSLLNTRYFMFGNNKAPDKSQVNALLDESAAKIIWITNDVYFIEESILRRFAYSLKFKGFSRSDREHIWHDLVRKHPFRKIITPAIIRELASSYPCNAAGIASALNTLKAVMHGKGNNSRDIKGTLEEILRRHTEAIGHQPVSPLNLLTGRYDLEALNLDTSPTPVLSSLKSFAQFRKDNRSNEGNINLLFWGKPGTGKTELAKYLAEQLSAELILKRASDLISKWVGQTEQNIREAFEEAEKDHAILFIDEADSFFINRQTAIRSWEVSQTNELLTQMENYKGILICCTNLLDNLDNAVLRRFACVFSPK